MIYRFTGKPLFIIAGIISCMTILFIPIGIIFFYMAARAQIEITADAFMYTMLTRTVIPFTTITSVKQAPLQQVYNHHGNVTLRGVAVVPLLITYAPGKTLKLSLNYFEKPTEIFEILMNMRSGKE